jgi:hypothetical protein
MQCQCYFECIATDYYAALLRRLRLLPGPELSFLMLCPEPSRKARSYFLPSPRPFLYPTLAVLTLFSSSVWLIPSKFRLAPPSSYCFGYGNFLGAESLHDTVSDSLCISVVCILPCRSFTYCMLYFATVDITNKSRS